MNDKVESEWDNAVKIARNLDPNKKDLPRTLVVQIMGVRQLERIADALENLVEDSADKKWDEAPAPARTVIAPTPCVHVLREGRALCSLKGPPKDWPEGHYWIHEKLFTPNGVRVERPGAVRCMWCLSMLEKEKSNA